MSRRPRLARRGFLACLGGAAVAGCLHDDNGFDPSPRPEAWISFEEFEAPTVDIDLPSDPPSLDVTVEPVLTDLEIPWDLAFDNEGDLFLTERTGRVSRFAQEDIATIAQPEDAIDTETAADGWWVQGGEGGTLGLAVSPDDTQLFVYYTANVGDWENRVVRYDLEASDSAASAEVILDGIPAANVHNGGRIRFGPEGYLWVTTGDADEPGLCRDPDSLAGKVLRIDEDGEPAPGNPSIDDGDPRIYTGGHRNVQGIDWIEDDLPIISEHGPYLRDEVSLLYPGGDYGWDDVRGGPDDDPNEEDEYGRYQDHPWVVPPLVHTLGIAWAPSGATWYTGEAIPSWHNRFLVGGLVSQRLYLVSLTPPGESPPTGGQTFDADYLDPAFTATAHTVLTDEIGRIRHIEPGPDGTLYACTSNYDGRASGDFPRDDDDRVVRIVPA